MRCPDCDDIKILEDRGDGVCSVCHGNGVGGFLDEVVDSTNPFGRGHIKCSNCEGSGQCPRCGGTGKISNSDSDKEDFEDSNSGDNGEEDEDTWAPSSVYTGGYGSSDSPTYESVKPGLTVNRSKCESFVSFIFWAIPALFVGFAWPGDPRERFVGGGPLVPWSGHLFWCLADLRAWCATFLA